MLYKSTFDICNPHVILSQRMSLLIGLC